ncbi:MAG: hypothetical protein M3174_07245 [Actinomycetota bacterium]|nr:hypothetical protein [Actinomycetota bacterium]
MSKLTQTKSWPQQPGHLYAVPAAGEVTSDPAEEYLLAPMHPFGPAERGSIDKSRAGTPPWVISPP